MDITRHVKTKFFAGFFILIPVIVTSYLIYMVVTSVDSVIYPLVGRLTRTLIGREIFVPGTGLVLLVIIAYMTGIFATNYLGKKMLNLGEAVFTKIPFVKSIYSSVKDMTDAFSSQTKRAFKEAVLVDFPFRGVRAIGFVTNRVIGEDREVLCSVFVPTTPNPTSGYLIMVPEKELTFLRMSVDEALKYIISLGTTRGELK
ncbi:MAG TPA: DUF502 domain-containing protein [Syntrophorhabdaceae bacterium]|jgi:uncharacterized membrane protein